MATSILKNMTSRFGKNIQIYTLEEIHVFGNEPKFFETDFW